MDDDYFKVRIKAKLGNLNKFKNYFCDQIDGLILLISDLKENGIFDTEDTKSFQSF